MSKAAYTCYVEQRYFDRYKAELEIITPEQCQDRGYGLEGCHKERLIDDSGRGYFDIHVTGFKTLEEAEEFKLVVDRG